MIKSTSLLECSLGVLEVLTSISSDHHLSHVSEEVINGLLHLVHAGGSQDMIGIGWFHQEIFMQQDNSKRCKTYLEMRDLGSGVGFYVVYLQKKKNVMEMSFSSFNIVILTSTSCTVALFSN